MSAPTGVSFPYVAASLMIAAVIALVATRWPRLLWPAATVPPAAMILIQRAYFHYTSDDAYISYRYARNLSEGRGLVWNPGEHVEGYSNFLWTLALAGADKAGVDIVLAGRWGGVALAIAAGVVACALALRLLDGTEARVAGVFAAVLLAASGPWSLWAGGGLEAPLFGLLVTAAALLHLREREHGALPYSGGVWALAMMTRPDAAVLVAMTGVALLVDAAFAPGRNARARALRRTVVWTLAFAALYVPYFAWRYVEYGWLFPNTYYAKVGSGLEQYQRGLEYATDFSREYAAWLLLLVPVAMAAGAVRRAAAAYLCALFVAWFAYVIYVGGDSLLRFRFFAPLLPLLYALVAASGAGLLRQLTSGSPGARRTVYATGVLAALALVAFTVHATASQPGASAIEGERLAVDERIQIGRWMRQHLPADASVAAVPVGAIAYESRLTVIDMVGINDEHIAHVQRNIGFLAAGHEKFDTEYVLGRRPDIILLFDGLAPAPHPQQEYAGLSGVIIPAVVDMVTDPRLFVAYEARGVQIQEGKWLSLLVRRDATPVMAQTQAVP